MASYFKMTTDFLEVAQILSGVVLKQHELREMRRADSVQVLDWPAPPSRARAVVPRSPQSSSICNRTLARGDLLDSRLSINVVSFSRNVVL